MSEIGHNSVDGSQLQSIVERIEAVEARIRDEQEARKEIYSEARSNGFDVKTIRKAVAIRRQDAAKREEEEQLLDLYLSALGMS